MDRPAAANAIPREREHQGSPLMCWRMYWCEKGALERGSHSELPDASETADLIFFFFSMSKWL